MKEATGGAFFLRQGSFSDFETLELDFMKTTKRHRIYETGHVGQPGRRIPKGRVFACALLALMPAMSGTARSLPVVQRTGGPLPLSVQNEVDAALERGRRGLLDGLAGVDADAIDPLTQAWAMSALLNAAAPEVIAARDARITDWRTHSPANDVTPAPGSEAWILAGRNALIETRGLEAAAGVPARLRLALHQAARARIGTGEPEGPPEDLEDALIATQLLLDVAMVHGAGIADLIDPATRLDWTRRLDGRIEALEQRAANPEQAVSAVAPAMPRILLRITFEAEQPPPSRTAAAAEWLAGHDPFGAAMSGGVAGRYRTWVAARIFNVFPTAHARPEDVAGEAVSADWRLELAERLLSTQRIEAATGAGFWTAVPDDKVNTLESLRMTALTLLILEAL